MYKEFTLPIGFIGITGISSKAFEAVPGSHKIPESHELRVSGLQRPPSTQESSKP